MNEHADKLIKEVFSPESPIEDWMKNDNEEHNKYISSPEFEQLKKDKDWGQIKEDTYYWIGDQCDDVMVDQYEDEREAWVKENPDEDEDDFEYSQDAYLFKEGLMEILLHKLYGVPLDWNQ